MPKTKPLPILPQPWQLPYLASGEASLIVVPVDLGGVFNVKTATHEAGKWTFKTKDLIIAGAAKYQPDTDFYVEEIWADEFMEGVGLVSRSKPWVEAALKPSEIGLVDWQPAETMPIEAARIWLQVTSVNCIQFGQLTGDDQYAMGWRGPGDMPVFCGNEDWVWAIGVRTISSGK